MSDLFPRSTHLLKVAIRSVKITIPQYISARYDLQSLRTSRLLNTSSKEESQPNYDNTLDKEEQY